MFARGPAFAAGFLFGGAEVDVVFGEGGNDVFGDGDALYVLLFFRFEVHFLRATLDDNGHATVDALEEVHYIIAAHADAPVGGGFADVAFLGGTVDVDAAAVGVLVVAFQAGQLNNAGDDRIPAGGIHGHNFACGAATFEYHALGLALAHFFGDGVHAGGGAVAAGGAADAEFGGADVVVLYFFTVLDDGEFLVSEGNGYAVFNDGAGWGVRAGGVAPVPARCQ